MSNEISSPDGKQELTLSANSDGTLSWSFRADGSELVKPSPTGLAGGTFQNLARRSVDSVWKPVWGKRAEVPDVFNEIAVDMKSYRFFIRVYNDGPKSDYRTHVEDYQVQTHEVSSAATLHLKLAPGGGACVLIEKQ